MKVRLIVHCSTHLESETSDNYMEIVGKGSLLFTTLEITSMLLNMLKGKLHSGAVTQCDLHYEGSVSIDQDLLEAADILPNERVDIWNITNGSRIQTYAIEAPRGSKTLGINGAAARNFAVGDRVIIAAFAHIEAEKARQHAPQIVILDETNTQLS